MAVKKTINTPNSLIAQKFKEIADLLEIDRANPFRVRAYRKAALSISSFPKSVAEMLESGQDLTVIPGVGKDLALKIQEIISAGELSLLKETEKRVPRVLSQLMKIEGLGPTRVKMIYDKLGVSSIEDLKQALDDGRVNKLRGFGPVLIQKIKDGLEHAKVYAKKSRHAQIKSVAELLLDHLKKDKNTEEIALAGSFRRRCELVGDLDILVAAKDGEKAIEHFISFELTEKVLAKGETRAAIRLNFGLQVDLRVIPKKVFGAALLYFTGSKEHNVQLRTIALGMGLKLNEYGLFKGKKLISGETEEEIYDKLGLCFIEPELREARGEIEASKAQRLPKLIKEKDIKGDLHAHTNETDGTASLLAMAEAAQKIGYEYVAITDHSQHLAMTKGLDEKRLRAQIEYIDELNSKLNNFIILKSIECDILEDGSLDLSDSILKDLDLVVCSIHSRFNLPIVKQSDRIIRAMDNKYFNILAHPTGRLINKRQPYAIELERVMKAALERGCFLELNAQPARLDLNDIYCKMAKEIGLKLAISSDAHSTSQFSFMEYGIYQARRGWLEKKDIINTLSLKELRKLLKRR